VFCRDDPQYALRLTRYRLWDSSRQRRIPADLQGSAFGGFAPTDIEADIVDWQVVRLRAQ
jgi:hypothetical protein